MLSFYSFHTLYWYLKKQQQQIVQRVHMNKNDLPTYHGNSIFEYACLVIHIIMNGLDIT